MEGCPCASLSRGIPLAALEASYYGNSMQEKPFARVLPWVVQLTVDMLEKGHTSKQKKVFSQFF